MNTAKFLTAAALAPLAFGSVHALAQVPAATAANVTSTTADKAPAVQPDNDVTPAEIVVTGSRISRPNLQSTTPITSISGAELFQTGQVSVGDQLNQLPQLGSTFGQSNSTRFLGTAGLNLLDLRNLGTQRTLVLVNGRRHVASDILNNAVSVDVNTIPTDLIDRVDIITGGNSAVYGSDAIAGVVNFILKDHFDGLQVRGQGGLSTYGDAGAQFVSVLGGKNFSDNRGNVAVNAEFAHQSQYFGSERPTIASQQGFLQVLPTGTGTASSPERLFFNDIHSASYSNTGVVRFGGNALYNAGTGPNGVPYYVPYTFTPDGNLVPITGQRVGFGPNGAFIGGNGENFRGGQQFQLQPQLDRVNINLVGHYSFSDAFEPFVEASWSHTHTLGVGSGGPAFINGGVLGDPREAIRLDNPFLTDQARGVITSQLLLTNPARVITGATTINVRETLLGLGLRDEQANRDTLRGVFGVRGEFNNDWKYEVSANYGTFTERTKILGNLNIQRFLLANDSVRNAAGQIVCRSQVDPTAAGTDLGGNPAVLAADVASCVPVNVLGGQFNNAQRNYVTQDTTSVGKLTQFDVNGFVSGNLSQLFTLPGGPVGFSIGGEYRRETQFYQQDPLVSSGYTFYNAIPTFTAPALEVKEAFGELSIPLVKDILLLKELTLSAAGRVSSYNTRAKTVYTYNFGADWYPVQDIHFRAKYGRAVRAPNLGELFTPAGQNYALVDDPCSTDNLNSGPNPTNRQANCAAAGRPAGYNYIYSNSLSFKSGGNPNLNAETSDSYTYGVVVQPHWVPGLSLSADYYKIKVKNVIATLDAQTIINQCYDSSTLANPYCGLFQRNNTGGVGPLGEIPFQIVENSLLASSLNYAQLRASGIDAEINYNHDFGNIGSLTMNLNYSHVLERDDYLDPTAPGNRTRVRGTLGVPIDKFRLISSFKHGPVTFGYTLRWIGKQYVDIYADYYSINGNPASDPYYASSRYYPVIAYHDLRVNVDVDKRFDFYLGVDNVGNKLPPYGLTGLGNEAGANGGGSGIYDPRGRFMYAGVEAKF